MELQPRSRAALIQCLPLLNIRQKVMHHWQCSPVDCKTYGVRCSLLYCVKQMFQGSARKGQGQRHTVAQHTLAEAHTPQRLRSRCQCDFLRTPLKCLQILCGRDSRASTCEKDQRVVHWLFALRRPQAALNYFSDHWNSV